MNAAAIELLMLVERVKAGLASRIQRDELGQTATEYTGIVVLIALIMVAIFALGLKTTIANALKTAVNQIITGK